MSFCAPAVRVPNLYVWIAGEGEERGKLETKASELGIGGRVRFLGWRTDRSALLRAANLCVFPSRWEPNGTVVVEAWAHNVPLVTTASAGPAWITRAGEDALVVPVDDHVAPCGCDRPGDRVEGLSEAARGQRRAPRGGGIFRRRGRAPIHRHVRTCTGAPSRGLGADGPQIIAA